METDTSTRATLRLDCADSATPQSRAKPAGAIGMHICEQIGGTAPVDPEQMEFLALATRIPFTAHFDVATSERPSISPSVRIAKTASPAHGARSTAR